MLNYLLSTEFAILYGQLTLSALLLILAYTLWQQTLGHQLVAVKEKSWHYKLFEATYFFWYAYEETPKQVTLSLYVRRLLVVLPVQTALTCFLIVFATIMIGGAFLFANTLTILFGFCILGTEEATPLRVRFGGERYGLWLILWPTYIVCGVLVAFTPVEDLEQALCLALTLLLCCASLTIHDAWLTAHGR